MLCSAIFAGIDSIEVNMKDQKMTVTGDIDPVVVVCKLRKGWYAEILSVGPAKEEKKKEESKKEETKKVEASKICYPPMVYYMPVQEEYPNNCVICWEWDLRETNEKWMLNLVLNLIYFLKLLEIMLSWGALLCIIELDCIN